MNDPKVKPEIVLTKIAKLCGYKKLLQVKRIIDKRVVELKQYRLIAKKIKYEKSKKGMSRNEKSNEDY